MGDSDMSDEILREMDEGLGIITLVSSEVNGEKFWAYVDIPPSKYNDFLAAQKADAPYTLTDFGDVLKYGLGSHEPPADVVEEMKAEYGIDPDFQDKLKNDVERQMTALRAPK
jgi:hypothetical protein|tara:strand:+ start:337 stop:675 length:339 start_codon:yes stop_codon:yes gene_type:complete